jgi:hypothetical protein
MGAHNLTEPHRGEGGTEEIVCGLVADRAVGLPLARDLADGGQARPLMLLLQPVDESMLVQTKASRVSIRP